MKTTLASPNWKTSRMLIIIKSSRRKTSTVWRNSPIQQNKNVICAKLFSIIQTTWFCTNRFMLIRNFANINAPTKTARKPLCYKSTWNITRWPFTKIRLKRVLISINHVFPRRYYVRTVSRAQALKVVLHAGINNFFRNKELCRPVAIHAVFFISNAAKMRLVFIFSIFRVVAYFRCLVPPKIIVIA